MSKYRSSASSRNRVNRRRCVLQAQMHGARGDGRFSCVAAELSPWPGRVRAVPAAGAPRRPLGRGSDAVSAAIEKESHPRNGFGQGSHLAKHDLHDVPDGVGGIFGSTATTQTPIDE